MAFDTVLQSRSAESPSAAIEARYRRAEALLQWESREMVLNPVIYPRWFGKTNCFWYERRTRGGREIRIVDAVNQTNGLAFDHERFGAALRATFGDEMTVGNPQVHAFQLHVSPLRLHFKAGTRDCTYLPADGVLRHSSEQPAEATVAPDGSASAYVKAHDLWLREHDSGRERRLTTDGLPLYSYATTPDGFRPGQRTDLPVRPRLIWSPDSRRLLTFRTDDRLVGTMPMIVFSPPGGGRPSSYEARIALPGDQHVTRFEALSIDVTSGRQVPARYPAIRDARMNFNPVEHGFMWWSADSRIAYFVELERGERCARVVEFDTHTGTCRVVFEERSDAYLDLGANVYARACIVPLPETGELIWYSARSGLAQLYLYDLRSGACTRAITSGPARVRDVLHVDTKRREVLFVGSGGGDPYVFGRSIAVASLETGEQRFLIRDELDHYGFSRDCYELLIEELRSGISTSDVASASPTGDYFVETTTATNRAPTTTLRDRDGRMVLVVESADASGLPQWWRWPELLRAVAADGTTPLNALVFRPSDWSPDRTYPVLDHEYGGPQVSWVNTGSFDEPFSYVRSAALAELGCIVVLVDGRGTASRDRAFHLASYGKLHTASNLEDHVAAIQQLAAVDRSVDLTRVGIHGFSGGGYMAVHGILRFSEFYRVGVAAAGNYDNRIFDCTWAERYHGLVGEADYVAQSTTTYAKNLRGKLLLVHGMLDIGVHPAQLFQLVDALEQENKDFDLVLLPNGKHELGSYAERRIWDYLVRHLVGAEPPAGIEIKTGDDLRTEKVLARTSFPPARAMRT